MSEILIPQTQPPPIVFIDEIFSPAELDILINGEPIDLTCVTVTSPNYAQAFNIYESNAQDLVYALGLMASISCACPEDSFFSFLFFDTEPKHDHEHGKCKLHPKAHFKKDEKCPDCDRLDHI